jgi:coenzyme F420 hydrogenase subunit delta
MLYPEIVVAGCGNPLYADDGFGPAVIEELKKVFLPGNVKAVDAGTAGPCFLFSMLDPDKTKKLIIIDIVDFGSVPGKTTVMKLKDNPPGMLRDATPGGVSDSLNSIKKSIEVIVIGCQPKKIPGPVMEIGLSGEVRKAVPKAVRMVFDLIGVNYRCSCMFSAI